MPVGLKSWWSDEQRARTTFVALIAGNDADIDLARAALLIANEEYPELDVAHYMAQLDSLAERVRELLGLLPLGNPSKPSPKPEVLDVLLAINSVLFDQEHFSGAQKDYYNACNSFLNDVLERHTGIPITLSLLYIEIGKRLGLQIDGIGLPLHFVVRCRLSDGVIYIDPYDGGRLLSEEECREFVNRMLRGKATFNPRWLEPVSNRQFLVRMLTNLKHIYVNKRDYARALSICDRILLLIPDAPVERRDRGIIHLHLKHHARALRDLKAYVELEPEADDVEEVKRQISTIRQIIAMMN
jgi:regulator of sirC expression with transglutaminase-like and TPR domain